jgi:periplasmic protein TonB
MLTTDQQETCEAGRMIPVGRPVGAFAWTGSLLLHGAIVLAASLIPDSWISLIQIAGNDEVAQIDSAFSHSSPLPAVISASVDKAAEASPVASAPRPYDDEPPDLEELQRELELARGINGQFAPATIGPVARIRRELKSKQIDSSVSRARLPVDHNSAIESGVHGRRLPPAVQAPAVEFPRQDATMIADFRPVPVPEVFNEIVAVEPEADRPAEPEATASQASQSTVVMAGSATVPAKPQFTPAPQYPADSVRLNEQGRVLLRVSITASGVVSGSSIVQSSGFARLDQAARTTVALWRFRPATRDGRPIETEVQIPVRFRL